MLSPRQRVFLLKAINPRRVLNAQGQSHLPAYDVEAYLTRAFGFEGWDREVVRLWLIAEGLEEYVVKGSGEVKSGWTVTYGCHLRLTVRDPEGGQVKVTDGVATGTANHLPLRGEAHDFAMKNADSYALKRAAKAWGDQFGLSLYNKGSLDPVVRASAAYAAAEIDDTPPEPQSLGNDERSEPDAPVSLADAIRKATAEGTL